MVQLVTFDMRFAVIGDPRSTRLTNYIDYFSWAIECRFISESRFRGFGNKITGGVSYHLIILYMS